MGISSVDDSGKRGSDGSWEGENSYAFPFSFFLKGCSVNGVPEKEDGGAARVEGQCPQPAVVALRRRVSRGEMTAADVGRS